MDTAIYNALSLCDQIAGPDEEQDSLPSRRGCAEVVEILAAEVERLHALMASAPVAIMDTRDVLGICAPTEEDFPALYALQGKRVRLVVDDKTPNAKLTGLAPEGDKS